MSWYSAIAVPLSCLSGIWIPATLLCCLPWVQRQMLYLHWLTFFPGRWLSEPERAGFLKNQVTPFRIRTDDGEQLFSWLVAPLGLYAQHAAAFVDQKPAAGNVEESLSFKLLRRDPEARLVIYFHGNTATIAQQRRTEEYRAYASGASGSIFILAFDYRGFGVSTGTPSEPGVVKDARAVVDWALNVANISPDRIVLLGHSLGTAVATAATHHYANQSPPVEFASLVLCAAFTNAGSAFCSYAIGGVFPVLAPVKMLPTLQAWFRRRMNDTWQTDRRLAALARQGAAGSLSRFHLVLVHAQDDQTMPWNQSEELFQTTLAAATDGDATDRLSPPPPSKVKAIDLGEAGRQETWQSGSMSISKLIARHGDHNTMMKWSPISLAVLQALGLTTLSPRL